MADSENWDGRAWGTSTSRKFSEVIDNRPLRIRTVGGVEGAEDQKFSPLSDFRRQEKGLRIPGIRGLCRRRRLMEL